MLNKLRNKLDHLDRQILYLVEKRLTVASRIGLVKKRTGLLILDRNRDKIVVKKWLDEAAKLKLNKKFIETLCTLIIKESKRIQGL